MKAIFTFLYLSLAVTPFLLPFGALDAVYTELFYLSVIQLITTLSFILYKQKSNLLEVLRHPIIFLLLAFLCWSLITIFTSFNPTEGIIDWFKFCLFYIGIINISLLFKVLENKHLFLFVLLSLLAAESFLIFYRFLNIYDFENPPSRAYPFVGFTSNLNVAAYSLLIKLPFAIYFLLNSKSRLRIFLASTLIFVTTFNVLIISSRSSILALLTIFVFLFILIYFLKRNQIKGAYKRIIFVLILLLGTLLIQRILYTNSVDGLQIERRMTSFDFDDDRSSSSFRLGFYLEAIQGFLDKPIFGYGIGNWKIFSIHYGSDRIREYQVPYHAHNDFLQSFAETGFVGGTIYLCIYLFPLFFLFKRILNKENKNLLEDFFIFLSIIIFVYDSSFNFPRIRAISMMNIIFIYSFFINKYDIKFNKKFLRKYEGKGIYIPFILLGLCSVIIFYKLYKNSVQQVVLIQDYNITKYFERDLEEINQISHSFPTLTHTGLPLSSAKANYYYYQGKKQEAIRLYTEGDKKNPFLGDADLGLAKIYLAEEKYDSAYYYSKISLDKLPYNSMHATVFQKILINKEGEELLREAESLFDKTRDMNIQALWENHLLLVVKSKPTDKFSEKDKKLAKEATLKFPDSKTIQTVEKLINYDKDIIVLANEYDLLARSDFKNAKYEKAIEKWEMAKNLIPNEQAYYLNIAQSYNGLGLFNFCLEELEKVEKKKIVLPTGNLEFLRGVANLGLEKYINACKNFRIAAEKQYPNAAEAYRKFNCSN